MASPQPPSNPFDGFDTYSTVVQQPPVTTQQQQSPQQQNPFASAIVDDGNPFATATMMQQPQPQQQPSPPHPQQSQPQLYHQQSQPSFYPQQQMIPVAPSAASPWAMQQQQQQLLAPQQNNTMASSPWGLVQSQPQQQLFPHVASSTAVDPLNALFGGGQNQQVQLHTQQMNPYALQQQQPPQQQQQQQQQQQPVAEVPMFDFEMTTNNNNNTSLLISKEEEEGLALIDVELDDNEEGEGEEDRKNDGDFLGEDGLNGNDVPTPMITKEGKKKKKSSTDQQPQQQQHQPWDRNPNIAPPPPRSVSRPHAEYLSTNSASPQSSPLPKYELVYHAGYVLSRISFRTVLMRKWKQSFWIQYGPTSILFFRSYTDYDDWLNNPYHTLKAREFLVKLRIDFVGDLKKPSVMGYQVTQIRKKPYGRNTMLHFKLERWMDYGPTIAAAFAAREDDMINSPTHHRNGVSGGNGADTEDGFNTTNDVTALRKIILGCMRNARDYAMIASREREEQMEGVAGMPSSRINNEESRMRGRYDNEYENRTMSSTATSSTRIPSSTRNMGFHQAFSAEASERRRVGDTGELPENDDLSEEEESSRNRGDKAPVVVPPVVDLLG